MEIEGGVAYGIALGIARGGPGAAHPRLRERARAVRLARTRGLLDGIGDLIDALYQRLTLAGECGGAMGGPTAEHLGLVECRDAVAALDVDDPRHRAALERLSLRLDAIGDLLRPPSGAVETSAPRR